MAAEFEHARADLVHFSPNENYMVTFSQKLAENDDPKDPKVGEREREKRGEWEQGQRGEERE